MNNSFWKEKRVFVTGCSGLLGSWLTSQLVDNGADVVGLIRDKVPQSQLVRSGTIHKINVVDGDVRDYALIERVLAEFEVEIIFHLAAQTIVGIANRAPLSTFETNVKGTWVILEAARRSPTVTRIVLASSDKAYGTQDELPYTEDAPLQGRHPYDVSKSCADLIAQAYANTYGSPIAITRCGNLYGGGDLNWNRIVPETIRSVLKGRRPVIRSDGTMRRDYLFVLDAVSAYLTVCEKLHTPEVCGQSFNFGLDQPKTALEIVQKIIDLSDHPHLEPIILNEAQNEIPDQYLDSRKAERTLHWHPTYGLEQGLKETLVWYRDFLAQT